MGKANEVTGAPYWLIVRDEDDGTCLLTFDSAGAIGGTDVLPVFSSREEAEILLLGKLGSGGHVRKCSNRELLSMLSGPEAAIKYVILDPWPGPSMEQLLSLVGVGRRVFADRVMGRDRSWFHARRNGENRNEKGEQRNEGALIEERPLRKIVTSPCGQVKKNGCLGGGHDVPSFSTAQGAAGLSRPHGRNS